MVGFWICFLSRVTSFPDGAMKESEISMLILSFRDVEVGVKA